MASPMPRLAPVTSATSPSMLISTSSGKLGQGRGKSRRTVQVMSCHTLGAALVESRQDLSGAAFNQIGHALTSQIFDAFHPANRAVELLHQLVTPGLHVGRGTRTDVLHEGDARLLQSHLLELLDNLLGCGLHQRDVG